MTRNWLFGFIVIPIPKILFGFFMFFVDGDDGFLSDI
jgi:hypothetical protein